MWFQKKLLSGEGGVNRVSWGVTGHIQNPDPPFCDRIVGEIECVKGMRNG
jgi:hypothetical protein